MHGAYSVKLHIYLLTPSDYLKNSTSCLERYQSLCSSFSQEKIRRHRRTCNTGEMTLTGKTKYLRKKKPSASTSPPKPSLTQTGLCSNPDHRRCRDFHINFNQHDRQRKYKRNTEARSRNQLPWKNNKYSIFSVCACSFRYPACKAQKPYYTVTCGLPGCNKSFNITE